ncbi:helix-turn-helix domain-containing protein [Intestinimonas sp.]|uniref:helix-turn-helix domain-containing protein n=1 Tax=Intestinimonas sp. TaxID=1965293 RepID=UPI0026292DD1|nr:helix-turn-helix transcriptional regulator [Intestinimonas sp.]
MNNRIAEVRKQTKLTQEKFAERLGLTRNFVWMIEKGDRVPSDRTITDICREFQVDEHWLRTGEGEMIRPMSRNDELARFLGQVITDDDDFKRTLLTVMSRMTTDEWAMLERKAWELVEEMKKTGPQ